ncbi:SusC/RagA family TonB-linked outer membrane protein [Pedobacter nyackensis]|nr:SusC/RagA family TonB-linked outer membrane protein [Pedobacter nyackensis]
MKLIILMVFATTLQVSAETFAQTISFTGKKVSIETIFESVERQCNYVFFYNAESLKNSSPVSVNLKNVSIETLLQESLKNQPIRYYIKDHTIFIVRKEATVSAEERAAVFFQSQQKSTIEGNVKGEDGKAIKDVSIKVKGTNRGTVTDMNGNFSIKAEKGDVLLISSLNYRSKEVIVGNDFLSIRLESYVNPLEAVVIGGNLTATKRKADVSSITTLTAEQLQRSPYQSVDQVLTGLVPGVSVVRSSEGGTYSSQGSVQIRGAAGVGMGSLYSGKIAVYVDGVEMPGGSYFLSTLDKNIVDRIEVVKGPSAATLYGSGSNGGVILVYTKKGKKDLMSIDAGVYAGWYDSKWQDKKPFRHMENFNIKQGFAKDFVYNIGGSHESAQTYQPGGLNRTDNLFGNLTYSKGKFDVTLGGRYNNTYIEPSRNARYDTSNVAYFNKVGRKLLDTINYYEQASKSASLNLGYKASDFWKHNLVMGYSSASYKSRNREKYAFTPGNSVSDNLYTEPTIRYFNALELGNKEAFSVNLLTGVEYKKQVYKNMFNYQPSGKATVYADDVQETTGLFGQLLLGFKDRYFLTLGAREDWDKNIGSGHVFSPRLGFTTNFTLNDFMVKPRVSWGKGTTAPLADYRHFAGPNPSNGSYRIDNPDIKSQEQAGWDYGLEVYSNSGNLKFEAVYYNNIISNAFSNEFKNGVVTPDPNVTTTWKVINIGKVANSGWEFSADYKWNIFYINANYSIINSTLKESQKTLDPNYDYPLVGERTFNNPKSIVGAELGANLPKLFRARDRFVVSVNLSRQSDIVGSDEYKSNMIFAFGGKYSPRNTMTVFPGANIYNINLAYSITSVLEFSAQCRNLTNNIDPMHFGRTSVGRGWLFGLKYNFNNFVKQ